MRSMYLSNTTLFDARGISSIYCIRYNYMFRRLTMAIFRLYMKSNEILPDKYIHSTVISLLNTTGMTNLMMVDNKLACHSKLRNICELKVKCL